MPRRTQRISILGKDVQPGDLICLLDVDVTKGELILKTRLVVCIYSPKICNGHNKHISRTWRTAFILPDRSDIIIFDTRTYYKLVTT